VFGTHADEPLIAAATVSATKGAPTS
jgi:hypothetical protein